MGFGKTGWVFFEAAKDEKRWAKAVKTATAQGGAETLEPLKAALFTGEQ